MRQGSPYGETREAQDEARQAQDGPRGTQYEARGTQNDPKKSQERPKMRQERPNMSQERPKMSQERPMLSQERPQRAKKKKSNEKRTPKLTPNGPAVVTPLNQTYRKPKFARSHSSQILTSHILHRLPVYFLRAPFCTATHSRAPYRLILI